MTTPVRLTATLDRPLQARGETDRVLLRVAVEGEVLPELSLSRPPLNLALVLDRSGSMAGDKLRYTKRAARLLIANLTAQDRLSIVAYDDRIETLAEPAPVVNKDRLTQALERLTSRGMTDLAGGWFAGAAHVRSDVRAGGVNRVLLLTDGLANQGLTDPDELATAAVKFKGEGITLSTIGFGKDFNEDLLRRLADAGGGNFFYIENPDQAPAVFEEELGELAAQCAQELELTATPATGVEIAEALTDYPTTLLDQTAGIKGGARFALGALFSGELKVLIAELDLPAVHDNGAYDVATLALAGQLVRPRVERLELTETVRREVVDAERAAGQEPDQKVTEDATLLRISRAQLEAVALADAGDIDGASKTLACLTSILTGSPKLAGTFAEEIKELTTQQAQLDDGEYTKSQRKGMVWGSHQKSHRKGKYK